MRMSSGKRYVEVHIPDIGEGRCTILSNGFCDLYTLSDKEVQEDYPEDGEVKHQVAYLFGLLARHLPADLVAEFVQLPQPA